MNLLSIFVTILLPIFIIIGIGTLLHKQFHFDMNTLAKLNLYYLVPGLVFIRLYETNLTVHLFFIVFILVVCYHITLWFISFVVSYFLKFKRSMRSAFTNSVLYYNSGNYGVSVNDLVFRQDPLAMSIQIIILTLQNLLIYSFGIFSVQANKIGKLKAFFSHLKMPVTYAMLIGLAFSFFNIQLPQFLYTAGSYIANSLIGIALLTLGAQVAQLRFSKNLLTVYLSVFMRLMLGPSLALLIIFMMNIDGTLAKAFFIASAMPTSVTTSIIAQEYQNEAEFSAQAVLASTMFSMITVTIVIYVSDLLF